MKTKSHWEKVYAKNAPEEVSWFQEHSEVSLQFILRTGVAKQAALIDIGGGASTLVDDLLRGGFEDVSVLDISEAALKIAQLRLGVESLKVHWLQSDITEIELPSHQYDLWHDRAVFHFLTNPKDRRLYVKNALNAIKPNGHIIVATFGVHGPLSCSSLDVLRYSPEELHHEFGDAFKLLESSQEMHETPFGTQQEFTYCYCRKP